MLFAAYAVASPEMPEPMTTTCVLFDGMLMPLPGPNTEALRFFRAGGSGLLRVRRGIAHSGKHLKLQLVGLPEALRTACIFVLRYRVDNSAVGDNRAGY